MNKSEWLGQIDKFKELLRVPVGDDESGVRSEYKAQIEALHNDIPDLLFESYEDWFDQDDGWLIRNLAQCLTENQDAKLLSLLRSDDDRGLLAYLSGTCVSEWRQMALESAPQLQAEDAAFAAGELVGAENTANWAASRTPGTFYYSYDGTEYLYSDMQRAPAGDWKPLPEREREAADRAQPWGAGWCTPTGGDPRYGGDYVFSVDREGPWVLQEVAVAQLAEMAGAAGQPADAAEGSAPLSWASVWAKEVGGAWKFGLTEQGPWIYSDGEVALRDQEIAADTVASLMKQYPEADPGYVRELVNQSVAATAH